MLSFRCLICIVIFKIDGRVLCKCCIFLLLGLGVMFVQLKQTGPESESPSKGKLTPHPGQQSTENAFKQSQNCLLKIQNTNRNLSLYREFTCMNSYECDVYIIIGYKCDI